MLKAFRWSSLAGGLCVLATRSIAQIPAKPPPYTPPELVETIGYYLDSAAISAGIPILRYTPLPEGTREIRLWVHGWYDNDGTLYRITSRRGSVRGEVVHHWPTDPRVAPKDDTIPSSLRKICEHFTRRVGIETCRALVRNAPDWREALHQAETAGVWVISDESEPGHPPNLATDGWGMFVELRDGGRYRAYSYSNPNVKSGHADFKRAVAVASAFRPIRETMRRGNNATLYRGLYVGTNESGEFMDCGSDMAMSIDGALPLKVPADSARMYIEFKGSRNINWAELDFRREFHMHVDSVVDARRWSSDACTRK